MKDLFPGYCKKSDQEIKDIWDSCIIVFDTNTLLNLYRYSDSTKKTILNLIEKFSDRIWLPHQAALEYNRNRYEVIADQEKAYRDFTDKIKQIQKDLQSTSKPPFLSTILHRQLDKVFERVDSEVDESINKYTGYLKEDPVYAKISELFNEKIGKPFSTNELKKVHEDGRDRYNSKIPPGYEDEKSKVGPQIYGDLVLWKQIIEKARNEKKNIVLITDERKTDWWWKIKDGRTIGPRQELVEELKNESGMKFHMYSTERFLSYGQRYLEEKVNQKALEELQAIQNAEMHSLHQKQVAAEKELRLNLDERYGGYLALTLNEITDAIRSIERKQLGLQDAGFEHPEIQARLDKLRNEKAELQEKAQRLKRRLERYMMPNVLQSNYNAYQQRPRNRPRDEDH